MNEHIRRRWWLRAALVALALLLAWSSWSADAGVNVFVGLWGLTAVVGALGSTLPGWRAAAGETRGNVLPYGLQGALLGVVVGSLSVLLVEGRAPLASGGLLLALLGVYNDLFRVAWRSRRASKGPVHVRGM